LCWFLSSNTVYTISSATIAYECALPATCYQGKMPLWYLMDCVTRFSRAKMARSWTAATSPLQYMRTSADALAPNKKLQKVHFSTSAKRQPNKFCHRPPPYSQRPYSGTGILELWLCNKAVFQIICFEKINSSLITISTFIFFSFPNICCPKFLSLRYFVSFIINSRSVQLFLPFAHFLKLWSEK